MRAEDVAREFQFREGFRLVDFAEVGLPVFRLTIEAVTTSIRVMPTIHEFVMRCMLLGESKEADIARMLGLNEDVVRGAVDALVLDGLVARSSVVENISSFSLTPLGEERLAEEAQEVAQEEMLVIDYDAIRRTPIRLAGENVVRAAELKTFGAVEIRPYPAEPPAVSELAIPEVSRAIRRQGGERFHRTVLALKRVVRRNNVFREAVALVFAANKGDEVQVAFAIDGKLSDKHERAFAKNGGPRKMGFVKKISEDTSARRLGRLIGRELVQAMPDAASIYSARKEEAEARSMVRSIETAVEGSRVPETSNPAIAALVPARERLLLANHELNEMSVRPLACFEQNELLSEAIANATRSLIVTSAGLQPTVLTQHLMRDMDQLTGEGVEVDIASFLSPQLEARGGSYYDPLAELTKRAEKHLVRLVRSRRASFFFLVKDDDLAVISNRPFFGDMVRRSSFQQVEGLVTRQKTTVKFIRDLADRQFGRS